MRPALLSVVLAGAIVSHGCLFRRAPKTTGRSARVFRPPPPLVVPDKPYEIPPPPAIRVRFEPLHLPGPPLTPGLPRAAVIPKRVPRRAQAIRAVVAPPPEAPPVEPVAPPPLPEIGQVVTPAQRDEFLRIIEQSLMTCEAILQQARGRPLNPGQTSLGARIQNFVQQARELKDGDIVTAKTIAERAGVLAEELKKSLE